MSWAAGVFTRVGGSTAWGDDRDGAIEIEAGLHDTHDEDLATGINACLKKDGTNAASADLNIGGFKITNLGTPAAATDAATKGYVDSSASIVYASGDQLLWRSTVNPYTLPTGWTRVAHNDKALRIVSSSGALSSGGSNAFSTALNSARTTATEAGHTHTGTTSAGSSGANATVENVSTFALLAHTHTFTTSAGSAHSHTLNLDVTYYEMNVIQKL